MKEKILSYFSFNDKKIFVLRMILIVSAVFLLISMALPYATATADFKQNLEICGDRTIDKDTGFTGNELVNVNVFEFITIHTHDTSYDGSGLIVGLLVAIIVFTIVTAILIGLKKDVLCAITSVITLLIALLVNFDFSDRGLIGYNYEWGISHFFYIFFAVVIIASAVALKILNKINKAQKA